MKKILACLVFGMFFVVSCGPREEEYSVSETTVSSATYSDWDSAIRADVDMQNMYLNQPRKISKPIDMYMTMALALKYNFTRRVVSYEESLIKAGKSPVNQIPEIMGQAGYLSTDSLSDANSELRLAWNLLDMSTVYYQTVDQEYRKNLAFEQSRKVIHNLLQETRVLYWQALTAQRLLPVIDDMIEVLTLEVDELNAQAKDLAKLNQYLPTDKLVLKREYMEAVKNLSELKRGMETAETKLAALMGFHPATEYKLVGKLYGNFSLPDIRTPLADMEWLALTNRPELKMRDMVNIDENLEFTIQEFKSTTQNDYQSNPAYYNKVWSRKAQEIGYHVFEDVKNPRTGELEALRRQRMTNLVLSQLYVGWAAYMSAMEDYQINIEIANVSEDIAEDITVKLGSHDSKSLLEAARAIADEVKASKAYIELQASLGNLYAALGLDALPYYMLGEKPSKIAVYLHTTLEKWRDGDFLPDNRPYLLNVPSKRPPVNLSTEDVPDQKLETGQDYLYSIPEDALKDLNARGNLTFKAGLIDDSPLPDWLTFDEKTMTFYGTPMPKDGGTYHVKVYIIDEYGNVNYITFKIIVDEVYVPSMQVRGLTKGRNATVLKRCRGTNCADDYIANGEIGKEIETRPRY